MVLLACTRVCSHGPELDSGVGPKAAGLPRKGLKICPVPGFPGPGPGRFAPLKPSGVALKVLRYRTGLPK